MPLEVKLFDMSLDWLLFMRHVTRTDLCLVDRTDFAKWEYASRTDFCYSGHMHLELCQHQ